MNLIELLNQLNEINIGVPSNLVHGPGGSLPVMCECDHGQWPEDVYSVEVLYRVRGSADDSDGQYGTLEEMLQYWKEDDLEKFVMIN